MNNSYASPIADFSSHLAPSRGRLNGSAPQRSRPNVAGSLRMTRHIIRKVYAYAATGDVLTKDDPRKKTTMTYNAANEITTPDDGRTINYRYWPDGQLAVKSEAHAKGAEDARNSDSEITKISNPSRPLRPSRENPSDETFLWDGLALLRRNDTVYIIEPHPSGGVPIASHPIGTANAASEVTYYLNDLLGTTLATIQDQATEYVQLTTFGQPLKVPASSADSPSPVLPTASTEPTNNVQPN